MRSTSFIARAGSPPEESTLLAALRRGDEQAFATVVDQYSPALLRLIATYVPCRAVAEEVLQECWLGVLGGLERFEGRSSLKTWIYRIAINTAMTRGERERRSVPFSSLAAADDSGDASVDADRFLPQAHDRWPGHWAIGPTAWPTPPEGLLAGETREVIQRAIDELPPAQRTVITLRDIEGCPADEVCSALGVSEGNQRVLLHRARTRVRAALEAYFGAVEPTLP